MPGVDLSLHPPDEQHAPSSLVWQSAHAEVIYQDRLFPGFDRDDMRVVVVEYVKRDRRFSKT